MHDPIKQHGKDFVSLSLPLMLEPIDLDQMACMRQFDRRATRFAENDYLLREVERRMFERLQVVRLKPKSVLDLGCGLGKGSAQLAQLFPEAQVLGTDFSARMIEQAQALHFPAQHQGLRRLFSRFMPDQVPSLAGRMRFLAAPANAEGFAHMNLQPNSVGLLWSNLMLHWLAEPNASLQAMYQVAEPGALFMFSCFGVDTLREIRANSALMPFRDMHDWGDALVETGFAEPVMDMETIKLNFSKPENLIKDLHRLGGNAPRARRAGLAPKNFKAGLLSRLADLQQASEEGLTLSIEVIYGHAWVPAKKKRNDGLIGMQFVPKTRAQ